MIVFMYPGQGSQQPGMGAAWVDHPSWELVGEASEVTARDVSRLLLHADAEELTETRNSQLATFVMSMVALDAVTRLGTEAAGHAGHSLGEYSALTAAGVLDFSDAVALVAERGDAMQAAAEEREGTMAAVLGLDDDDVQIACSRSPGEVWLANHNAPGQAVIAGTPEAIDTAAGIARELGAKRVMPLQVGGAFHTPFMAPARDRLTKAIDRTEFRDPQGTVVANVDAAVHNRGSDWPDLLKAQLTSPVRWRQTMTALAEAGFTTFVELGPGEVLGRLAKRAVKGTRPLAVSVPGHLDSLLEALAASPSLTRAPSAPMDGEHLFATERLVVSPSAGIFEAAEGVNPGTSVDVGQQLGQVGTHAVRSPFAGELMGVLALNGERVTASQPIAWLRTS
ncbi:MAG: ACP S-malonyltransferase [Acidimicrobiaceae bacterium]|nr:ACP S-malonyltransferase [Acidimicrobiaceae bacterium]MCY4175650.1 ACP S-malonyltransferase [Acidimicrobiaceae bacterium]MCY4279853.1 ACP S-malonyltransferase [Acidimicrobiaceae bacterium]MCY4294638.1 ACP S-malonyltransferase [Acidimicrobiaceae bacterium]